MFITQAHVVRLNIEKAKMMIEQATDYKGREGAEKMLYGLLEGRQMPLQEIEWLYLHSRTPEIQGKSELMYFNALKGPQGTDVQISWLSKNAISPEVRKGALNLLDVRHGKGKTPEAGEKKEEFLKNKGNTPGKEIADRDISIVHEYLPVRQWEIKTGKPNINDWTLHKDKKGAYVFRQLVPGSPALGMEMDLKLIEEYDKNSEPKTAKGADGDKARTSPKTGGGGDKAIAPTHRSGEKPAEWANRIQNKDVSIQDLESGDNCWKVARIDQETGKFIFEQLVPNSTLSAKTKYGLILDYLQTKEGADEQVQYIQNRINKLCDELKCKRLTLTEEFLFSSELTLDDFQKQPNQKQIKQSDGKLLTLTDAEENRIKNLKEGGPLLEIKRKETIYFVEMKDKKLNIYTKDLYAKISARIRLIKGIAEEKLVGAAGNVNPDKIIIIIKPTLTEEQKDEILSHEIGHIASEFVYYGPGGKYTKADDSYFAEWASEECLDAMVIGGADEYSSGVDKLMAYLNTIDNAKRADGSSERSDAFKALLLVWMNVADKQQLARADELMEKSGAAADIIIVLKKYWQQLLSQK